MSWWRDLLFGPEPEMPGAAASDRGDVPVVPAEPVMPKLCIDCRWCELPSPALMMGRLECTRPRRPVGYTEETGAPIGALTAGCEGERGRWSRDDVFGRPQCGPGARFWEARLPDQESLEDLRGEHEWSALAKRHGRWWREQMKGDTGKEGSS